MYVRLHNQSRHVNEGSLAKSCQWVVSREIASVVVERPIVARERLRIHPPSIPHRFPSFIACHFERSNICILVFINQASRNASHMRHPILPSPDIIILIGTFISRVIMLSGFSVSWPELVSQRSQSPRLIIVILLQPLAN